MIVQLIMHGSFEYSLDDYVKDFHVLEWMAMVTQKDYPIPMQAFNPILDPNISKLVTKSNQI